MQNKAVQVVFYSVPVAAGLKAWKGQGPLASYRQPQRLWYFPRYAYLILQTTQMEIMHELWVAKFNVDLFQGC